MSGISLTTMRSNVLQQVGVDAVDVDATGSANLDLWINKSWWQIMDIFDFREKETSKTIALVVGTNSYDLASLLSTAPAIVFDALRDVSIQDPNTGQYTELTEISLQAYNDLYSTDTSLRDIPANYVRDGGSIIFWPVPNNTYNVKLDVLAILSDVPSAGPVVPQSWHEIIEKGAVVRGHEWFRDFNSAREVQASQGRLIAAAQTNSAKEDRYTKMAGVSVPTREFGRRY